jgi:hypothetical protein
MQDKPAQTLPGQVRLRVAGSCARRPTAAS